MHADLEDSVGYLAQEVAVMGARNDRALKRLDGFLQHLLAWDVQVVGGLCTPAARKNE